MKSEMLAELNRRFWQFKDQKIYSLSTFLDPRYKEKFLLEDGQIFLAKIQAFIKEEIQAENREISPDPDVLFSPPEVIIQAAPTKREFSLLARMDKIASAESSNLDLNFLPEYEPENDPQIISISSSEETISADLVGPSGGHFAAVPSDEDEDELNDDDIGIGTSIPLNQVSPLPQMGLEEMPAVSTAETGLVTRNKNRQAAEREREKYIKQTKTIDSLNAELGVVAQNSSTAKWQTLQAYGQYILWLEKILLNNQGIIRNQRRQWIELGSLIAAKEKPLTEPESHQIQSQIQLFELYIKNAEENAEYENYSKTMFRLDKEEISKKLEKEFGQKIQGISGQSEMRNIYDGRKQYLKNENGKLILLLILPKFFMRKQDINKGLAIDWAKKYGKSLREDILKYGAKELKLALAHRPNFFEMPSDNQPALVTIAEIQPNKELDKKEWDSFKEDVKREMGIHKTKKRLGIWLILDAYRRDILWLESLLLSHQHKIRNSLILSSKKNLIPNFNLLIKSAETNRAYIDTSADIFKLTSEEIDNDPDTKGIPHALETVEKKNLENVKLYKAKNVMAKQALYAILPKFFMKKTPIKHIKNLAFEWARQYRKMLRVDYLVDFENVWKPGPEFMPDIVEKRNQKFGTASTSQNQSEFRPSLGHPDVERGRPVGSKNKKLSSNSSINAAEIASANAAAAAAMNEDHKKKNKKKVGH